MNNDIIRAGLLAWGFDPLTVAVVALVSRPEHPGLSYQQWIERLRDTPGEAGRLARAVKLSDLADNLSRPTPAEMKGIEKRYNRAVKTLS